MINKIARNVIPPQRSNKNFIVRLILLYSFGCDCFDLEINIFCTLIKAKQYNEKMMEI